ncbi:MAG TPA: hypothetical protein VGW36_02305 [Pyrinomonadaceae bacterium]|nr:hypothetical protein [Pyrinomonadaceae bacterium]
MPTLRLKLKLHYLSFLTLCALLTIAASFPTATAYQVAISGQDQQQLAEKFDEFGELMHSDLAARLDNFAVRLQEQPNVRGYLIVYRSRRDLPGLSHALALRMKNYLVDRRRLPKERVIVVDGGVASALTQELWIASPGSAPKPRDDARIGHFDFRDAAWKFYEYSYLTPALIKQHSLSTESDSEAEYLEAFANAIKREPAQVACIIAYAQYRPRPGLIDYSGEHEPVPDVRLDPPGTARRRLALEKKNLMNVYGLPAEKIKTIDGGYKKRRAVELWIVPAGESLPVPTPNAFPRRRKK